MAPQVHRGRRRPARAAPGRRCGRRTSRRPTVADGATGRRDGTAARHPHAVAVVLPARSSPPGSRSSGYAAVFLNPWLAIPGLVLLAVRHLRLGTRARRPSRARVTRALIGHRDRSSRCSTVRGHRATHDAAHDTAHRRRQRQARRCGCSCRPTACSSVRSSRRTCSTATGAGRPGPRPQDLFDIPFTSVTSFILLMSSLTMVLALAAIQRGDHRRFRIWIMATALFGATFIGGQIFEFTEFTREGLNLDTSLFGSSFFVLTGLHGAHVDHRHRVAGLALGSARCRGASRRATPNGRDRRPLLALRRRGLDRDLHRHLPDPEVRRSA